MALPTFTPAYNPAEPLDLADQITKDEAKYGDGYEQLTPRGINHIRLVAQPRWRNIDVASGEAIYDFLRARRGTDPFYWTPPYHSTARRWRAVEFSRSYRSAGTMDVSATFREYFGSET